MRWPPWMALALVSACSTTSLPPLPEPVLTGTAETVQVQIRDHWTKASDNPTHPLAVGELGRVLFAYGQVEASAACFRRSRILDPGSFRWAYLLGVAEATLGRSEAAGRVLGEALAMRPGNVAAAMRLADVLEQSGNDARALEVLESALEAAPDSPAALYRMGRLRLGREPARSMTHLEAALAIEPDYAEARYALANAYRAEGRETEAEAQLELYRQADRTARRHYADPLIDSLDAIRSASAQAVFNEALALQQRGDLDAARAAYDSVLEIDPNYAQAHVNLITVFGERGDHASARRHYDQAVALDPAISEAHYNLGVSLHLSSEFQEAETAFRQALEINDQNADAHSNLATVLEQLGRSPEAERHYHLALRNNPSHPMANFHLGRRLAESGRYREALPYLQRAVSVESPGLPLHGYVLALVYRRLGQGEQARAAAQSALGHARAGNHLDLEEKIRADFPR